MEGDIPDLVNALDVQKSCARVVALSFINFSSGTAPGASTVAHEALHFITAYWCGYYPVTWDGQNLPASRAQALE